MGKSTRKRDMNAQTKICNALDPSPTLTQQQEIKDILVECSDSTHQELQDLVDVLLEGDFSRLFDFKSDTLSALVRILELF